MRKVVFSNVFVNLPDGGRVPGKGVREGDGGDRKDKDVVAEVVLVDGAHAGCAAL